MAAHCRCSGEASCSGRTASDAEFFSRGSSALLTRCQQRPCRSRGVSVSAGMQPFRSSPLIRAVDSSGSTPHPVITGCLLPQHRPSVTRLPDRGLANGSGTVLLDQSDPVLQQTAAANLSNSITNYVDQTNLPTRYGMFRVKAYTHSADGGRSFTEPMVIMTGEPEGQSSVVVRVHDACFTSEVLGSLKCDCAEQLALALEYIQQCPPGIVIYLQQEGRGIGLANKIKAYSLQEQGYDTVDANRALGFADDLREYTAVRNILDNLGIKSIRLMTNNPRKIELLRALGIKVRDRIPCIVKAQKYNEAYLSAKASRMSHDFDGSYCYWQHDGEPLPPTLSRNGSDNVDAPDEFEADESDETSL